MKTLHNGPSVFLNVLQPPFQYWRMLSQMYVAILPNWLVWFEDICAIFLYVSVSSCTRIHQHAAVFVFVVVV